jgi:hypothetical protein
MKEGRKGYTDIYSQVRKGPSVLRLELLSSTTLVMANANDILILTLAPYVYHARTWQVDCGR